MNTEILMVIAGVALVAIGAALRYIGRKPKQFQLTIPPGADMAQAMDKSAMERIHLLADFPPSRFVSEEVLPGVVLWDLITPDVVLRREPGSG